MEKIMKSERLSGIEMSGTERDSRDEMVRQNMGLVHHTVERLCGSVGRSSGSFDDLISAGMMGLLNAYDGFDPSRGVAFSTYAHPRVRGAVLDELRKLDFVPRSVRRKKRTVSKARDAVRARSGGSSPDSEVAAEIGIDVETLRGWELDSECSRVESLDAGTAQEAAAARAGSNNWITEMDGADVMLEKEEQVEVIREALAGMPEQQRLVLILYFYEDLKLKQIGELIGVSESRVSQIRAQGLARLRRQLSSVAA
jgi:RNA polymerase sigma factor for flagellar operon FliA